MGKIYQSHKQPHTFLDVGNQKYYRLQGFVLLHYHCQPIYENPESRIVMIKKRSSVKIQRARFFKLQIGIKNEATLEIGSGWLGSVKCAARC